MGYSTDEETARKSVEKTENVLKRYNLCIVAQKGGHVNTLHEAFNVERFNDALKPLAESPRLAKAASDPSTALDGPSVPPGPMSRGRGVDFVGGSSRWGTFTEVG